MYRNSNIGAREGDNRGGLAGEWWDGQNFPWGGRFVKLSLPARGFSDSTVDCEIRIDYSGRVCDLGEEVCWKVGQRSTCLLSTPALGAPAQRVRARCAPKIYAQEIIAKT